MTERVSTVEAAATAFLTLADAEGDAVPMYARLCRAIAADRQLAGLLLAAPTGQRLPVLVLAALHDLVLERPEVALGAWYPSVGGDADHDGDLADALHTTVLEHREHLEDRVRHRRVQTNEVNRCVAWLVALSVCTPGGGHPLALVELGASAGLNLLADRYRADVHGAALDRPLGVSGSTVRLGTRLRTGPWLQLGAPVPPVVWRAGIDQHPLDPTRAEHARWLTACVWPEQAERLARLRAALEAAVHDPAPVHVGDLVSSAAMLVEQAPDDAHVVVLSSWALAYVDRDGRRAVLDDLQRAAAARRGTGGITLLTLEAAHLLPWVAEPPLPADATPALRHASLLAVTELTGDDTVRATPLARCQAHLSWMDRLAPLDEPA